MSTTYSTKRRRDVLGIHDPIPPEGRLKFELMNERGRVIHRTRATNALSVHLKEALATQLRGQGNTVAIGFDQTAAQTLLTDTDNVTAAIDCGYPRMYAQHRQFLRSLFLSDYAVAFSPNEWLPLGLQAGANLEAAYSGNNARRGAVQVALCQRTREYVRHVVDFGLDIANGFPIQSAGMAGLTFTPDAQNGLYAWSTLNVASGNSGNPGYSGRTATMANIPGSAYQYWGYGEEGMYKANLKLSTSWTTAASCREIAGPLKATWGSPVHDNTGLAIIGTDMWFMDTLRLRKTAIPTGTTLPTVLNTYSPVTGFTDAACQGMCTDGTNLYAVGSTKVFVISPATGAVTSSWLHNCTNVYNIQYDATMDLLLVCGTRPGVTYGWSGGSGSAMGSYADLGAQDLTFGLCREAIPFTKAGVLLGPGYATNYKSGFGGSNSGGWDAQLMLDGARYRIDTINQNQNTDAWVSITNGGMLGSRALVDTPFTKTNVQYLRVQYEFGFSA
jgi:hypothetical protein